MNKRVAFPSYPILRTLQSINETKKSLLLKKKLTKLNFFLESINKINEINKINKINKIDEIDKINYQWLIGLSP